MNPALARTSGNADSDNFIFHPVSYRIYHFSSFVSVLAQNNTCIADFTAIGYKQNFVFNTIHNVIASFITSFLPECAGSVPDKKWIILALDTKFHFWRMSLAFSDEIFAKIIVNLSNLSVFPIFVLTAKIPVKNEIFSYFYGFCHPFYAKDTLSTMLRMRHSVAI